MRIATRLATACLLITLAAPAQVAESANSGYKTPEGRARVGQRLDAADRDSSQKPQDLVRAMDLKPGMTVADIGTGVGYMLPHLSRAVGSSGKVIAQDIFPDFLDKARDRASRENLANVTFLKGTETDPSLPAAAVDVAFALDSYHHYDYPDKMLAGIRQSLRPGGRFVVVEYYKRPGAMPNGNAVDHIRLDEADVIKEIEGNGFKMVSKREHIKGSQYMVVFEKN